MATVQGKSAEKARERDEQDQANPSRRTSTSSVTCITTKAIYTSDRRSSPAVPSKPSVGYSRVSITDFLNSTLAV
jgi:hypothetical protein